MNEYVLKEWICVIAYNGTTITAISTGVDTRGHILGD